MEWNDEVIARLRALWDEGHSTAEIGRRLGVSKNAIVGKAHRLSLPPRPSPIKRSAGETTRPASTRRAVGSTLPPLPAHDAAPHRKAVAATLPPTSSPATSRPAVASAPARMPEAAAPPVAMRALPQRSPRLICCCWPIGEPGTPSFHFCDTDALAGKPYCSEHAKLAYVKVRDRRDEAA